MAQLSKSHDPACATRLGLGLRSREPGSALAFVSVSTCASSTGARAREPGRPTGVRQIQSTPAAQSLDPDDALARGDLDRSVLIVVVVMMVIGLIGVAAMVASVIGHRVSDCRATDAAHDRANRTANNSPGDSAADRSSSRAAFVSKSNLR